MDAMYFCSFYTSTDFRLCFQHPQDLGGVVVISFPVYRDIFSLNDLYKFWTFGVVLIDESQKVFSGVWIQDNEPGSRENRWQTSLNMSECETWLSILQETMWQLSLSVLLFDGLDHQRPAADSSGCLLHLL